MLPLDRWPEMVDGTYSRAAVQRFLEEAEAARERAEALLDVANQRRRLLHAELAEILERNAALARELHHTSREVHTDRQSTASAIAVVIAAAEAEAAAILARAQDDVAMISARAGRGEARARPPERARLALVTSASDGPTPTEPPLLVS